MNAFRNFLLACLGFFATVGMSADLPDLVATDFQVPATITAPPFPAFQVSWTVTNQGPGDASGYWTDIFFWSTQPFYDSSASFLGYTPSQSFLAAGEAYSGTNNVTVLPVTQSGTYYLIFYPNAYGYLQESDPTNNPIVRQVTFVSTPADMVALNLIVPTSVTSAPNPWLSFAYAITNVGPGSANRGWVDAIFVSPTSDLGPTARQLWSRYEPGPVASGGGYWRTNSVRVPVTASGTYYLILQADSGNALYEPNLNNNLFVVPVHFEILPPDLTPLALLTPSAITAAPNSSLTFVWGVTNAGTGEAVGDSTWWDALYLSTNSVWDASAYFLLNQGEHGPVPPGGTYWRTNSATLPPIASGTWYLHFRADAYDWLVDANRANNTLSVPVTFTIIPPDLVPIAEVPPVLTGPPYMPVTIAFGATNQGPGAAIGAWQDYVYLSSNPTIDNNDPTLGFYHNLQVPSGGSYWNTNTFRLPVTGDGTFYFIFQADTWSSLLETDRSNNILTVPVSVHILPPDLVPFALQLPTVVTCPPNPEITFMFGITNQGIGPAIGNSAWVDTVYISTNALWDMTATPLSSGYQYGPIAAGSNYWTTNSLHLPIVRSGTYYFTLRADANSDLIESDEQNNSLTVPVTFIVQPPDLVPLVSQVPSSFSGPPNPSVTFVWGVTNQGEGLARGYWSGWYDGIYCSRSPALDSDAIDLGWLQSGPLAPGSSYWQTNTLVMPITQSGTWYVFFKADKLNSVYEEDKSNNVAVVPITFTILPPDLTPLPIQVPAVITGPPNPPATIVLGVTNQGIGPAVASYSSWSDVVYLSRNAVIDPSDSAIIYSYESGPVAPGQAYWRTNNVRIPVTQSTNSYLILQTDTGNSLFESNESNNVVAVPVRFEILPPDLAPVAFLASDTVTGAPNLTLTFVWGVTNQGTGAAEGQYGYWSDRIYISTNSVFDSTALNVGGVNESAPIPAGGSYWRTNQFRMPIVESGTYYLFFNADMDQLVHESNFANNTVTRPITLTILPPDLAVTRLDVPRTITVPPNPLLTLSWGVTNQGVGATGDSWEDAVYLSTNPVLDYNALRLGVWPEAGPLEAGGAYQRTNSVRVPLVESGDYYLILTTDEEDWLAESDMGNNSVSVPVTFIVQPPDLRPIDLHVQSVVSGPPNPTVTVIWGVTNQGAGDAITSWNWSDQLYLCDSADPSSSCSYVIFSPETTTVPAGGSYWRTNTVHMPVVHSGTYFLRLDVNATASLYESCLTNNEILVPVTFQIQPPDLAPILFQAPATVSSGPFPNVRLVWGVTNQGPGKAVGNPEWSDLVYFSTDAILNGNDTYVARGYQQGPVTPEGNYWYTTDATLPVTQSGTYYLILNVDADQVTYDGNYSNNTAVLPIICDVSLPDLAPLGLIAPQQVTAGPNPFVSFIWGVTNYGSGDVAAQYSWGSCDAVYLSATAALDSSAVQIFSSCILDPTPAGGSYWRTNGARVQVSQSGNYFFILKTDSGDAVPETNETNNTTVLPVSITIAPPDLAIGAVNMPTVITGVPNPAISVVYNLTNLGPGSVSAYDSCFDIFYVSQTNILDSNAQQTAWSYSDGALPAGGSRWNTNSVLVPLTQSGTCYLLIQTDADNFLHESNIDNNVTAVPLSFVIEPSDVAVFDVQPPIAMVGPPYQPITVEWAITNQGPRAAVGSNWHWLHGVFRSTSPTYDSNAVYITSFVETNTLQPGGSIHLTNTVYPSIATNGQYYILLQANLFNSLCETETNNDMAVVPLNYTIAFPDLEPISLQAPAAMVSPPYPSVTVSWAVTNQGVAAAPGFAPGVWPRTDRLWLATSTNDQYGPNVLVLAETNPVAPAGVYSRTNTVRLPITQSGTYYLVLNVNSSVVPVPETDSSNNTAIVPISLDIRPPDLMPLGFQAPAVVFGEPNPQITIVWGVTNQGIGPALPPTQQPRPYFAQLGDGVYLSQTPGIENLWPFPFAFFQRNSPVAPGTSYWQTNTVRVPIVNSGMYYLIFVTDANNAVLESDEANNTVVVPITFHLSPPGDIAPVKLIAPQTVQGPGNPVVTVAWEIANLGPGSISDTWSEDLSIYGTGVGYQHLAFFWGGGPLAAGDHYWRTNEIIMPVTQSGAYQLVLNLNYGSWDLDSQNNSLTVPIAFNVGGMPAVRLGMPVMLGASFSVPVYGELGGRYRLEASSDLVNWTRVMDFICLNNPTPVVDSQPAQFERRFYRVAPVSDSPPLQLELTLSSTIVLPGRIETNSLSLKVDGPLGGNCRVESSSNLLDWQQATSFQFTTSPAFLPLIGSTSEAQLFYRAVLVP